MTDLKTYDPKGVSLSIGGFLITGYEPGTFITLERQSNTFDFSPGPDGEHIRTRKNDQSALMTLSLRQVAASNLVLSHLARRDESDNDGVVALILSDVAAPETRYAAGKAYIEKPAGAIFGDSPQHRQWIIRLVEVPMVHGGTPGTSVLAGTLT